MTAEPLVSVRCAVCAGAEHTVICAAWEVRAQGKYLRRFHRRRLRADSSVETLADRAAFTQHYETEVVACRRCGLVFRNPRPTEQAIRRAYAGDRSGRQRLEALRVPNGECFRWAAAAMRRLPHPLGGWRRAAMAWNNLLAFPYLNGYSVRTLDQLLAAHGFERLAARADTLARLADEQTKAWAAGEERALKLLCRLAGRAEALRPGSGLILAPWIDAYFGTASQPQTGSPDQ